MTVGELRRLLSSAGAKFEEGTKHTKVYLNGKQSTLPRHVKQELGKGFVSDILKYFGIRKPPR